MNKIDLRRVDLNLLVVFDVLMVERSVTRAAERLGRTQSAVSHALERLRGQLGDPLLVRSGSGMDASPFAQHLAQEVRPILSSIQRVLLPPQVFDAATTTREFRVALPDLNDSLFPNFVERVHREAPSASLEWVVRDAHSLAAVADGQIDIALMPAATALPDSIEHSGAGELRWASFMRKGHPAAGEWGRAAWLRWPHLAVRVGVRMPSPVTEAATRAEARRKITTWVPHFSAVAPLLARTDLIATLPVMALADTLDRYGLIAMKTPIHIDPMPHRLVWSRRLGNDPALRWLRMHLERAFAETLALSERMLTTASGTRRK